MQEAKNLLKSIPPFKPDPERLDPHMEDLCRKVRKFSVNTSIPTVTHEEIDGCMATKEYELTDRDVNDEITDEDPDSEKHQTRLQNDWIARSLTSIGMD